MLRIRILQSLLIGIAILTWSMPNNQLINLLPAIYLYTFFVIFLSANAGGNNHKVLSILTPSSLLPLYVSMFFCLGAFAFKYGYVNFRFANMGDFYLIENLGQITSYIILAIFISLGANVLGKRQISLHDSESLPKKENLKYSSFYIAIPLIAVSILYQIVLPFSNANISSLVAYFSMVEIAYRMKRNEFEYRYLIYLVLVLILFVFFYKDRRTLIFFMFSLYITERAFAPSGGNQWRRLLMYTISAALIFVGVIGMSITRGVGNYNILKPTDSIAYIERYLKADWAATQLFHNFETTQTLFHTYNAIDRTESNSSYRFGSTIIKVLFLPIPRSAFPNLKPDSMVDAYTKENYPVFRSGGGSFVPNFYAEMFWNFGFLGGLLSTGIFLVILDRLYYSLLHTTLNSSNQYRVFFISTMSFVPIYFRGSGLEVFTLIIIVFFSLTKIYNFSISKIINSS